MVFSEVLVHGTGITALALSVSGLVHKCDRTMHAKSGFAALLWAANNFLIGAHGAAALSLVSAGRQAAVNAVDRRSLALHRTAFAFFVLLTTVVAALTWSGPISAAVMGGSLLSCLAAFKLSGAPLRWVMFASSILWGVYSISFLAWWAVAANLLAAGAAAWGAIKVRQRAGLALPATLVQ